MMKKIASAGLFVILSPLLLLVGLVCLICHPFWLLSYKRSPWYRERGERYTWGIDSALYYKIYNLASKKDLPLKHEQIGNYHLFSCGGRLLFPICDYTLAPEYDVKQGRFTVRELHDGEKEQGDPFPLEEYLLKVTEELGEAFEGNVLAPIISESDAGDYISQAQDFFLVYADKNDLLRILEYFCSVPDEEIGTEQCEEDTPPAEKEN